MGYATNWSVTSAKEFISVSDISCSADGQYVLCSGDVGSSKGISVSSDYGVTWTSATTTSIYTWGDSACSSTGEKMYISAGDKLYGSSDYGVNWSNKLTANIKSVCCSSDGATVYVQSSTKVKKSTDSGTNWSDVLTVDAGSGASCCSANGSKVYVVSNYYNTVNYSSDGGSNWVDVTPDAISTLEWYAIACSDDGATVYLKSYEGDNIFITTNSGTNWSTIALNADPDNDYYFYDLTCSSDGSKAILGSRMGVHSTANTGSTWVFSVPSGDFSRNQCAAVATTSDGAYSYTFVGSGIYAYAGFMTSTPTPDMSVDSITPSTGSTAGGTPVTIVGSGFDPAATAAIDGNNLTDLVVVDDTTITGITPAGTAGAKDVTVTNP